MSLPTFNLYCTNCDYESTFNFLVDYQFEEGYDSIYRPAVDQGWCDDCQLIVSYVRSEDIAPSIKRINRCEDWVKSLDTTTRFQRVIRFIFPNIRKSVEKERNRYLNSIEEEKQKIAYIQNNPITPKCLRCGSNNVEKVHLPDYGKEVSIGKHKCGGDLMIYTNMGFIFNGGPVVVFDRVGNIISDERKESN